MSPELSKRLVAAVDEMPAFPKSVQRVLELTRDVNTTPKALVDVIDKDPVLTVKILRVVNSAYYSLPKQITSVGHAVVYLGFNTIKNLALSIAKLLALHLSDADPMDCFIAGLLHDFGKVVLAQFVPKEFRLALETSQWHETSLHLALRKVIGVDHAAVGAMLVEKGRFPPQLVETIGNQFGPALKDSDMIVCVFAANQISKQLQFGFGGNPCVEVLTPAMERRLGGSLDQVIISLGDLMPMFEEAKIFAKV